MDLLFNRCEALETYESPRIIQFGTALEKFLCVSRIEELQDYDYSEEID